MGAIPTFAVWRGWLSWGLWTFGVTLRWSANVTLWQWRFLLPLSALAELAGFLIFFATVSGHRSNRAPAKPRAGIQTWMLLVIVSTVAFAGLVVFNAATCLWLAFTAAAPEFPHWLDQRFLVLATWGVPVLAVWGFNARWLPGFMGTPLATSKGLCAALVLSIAGIVAALSGYFPLAAALLLIASVAAAIFLNIFDRPDKPGELQGVHPAFANLVRVCYVWLAIAAGLSLGASVADHNGGIWGASRHALTVGFLAGMVFAIGPRVLPAFCGGRRIFSPALMLAASSLLNIGCFLRVFSEIPAYEGLAHAAWRVLPVSAVVELAAVTLFALNMGLTLAREAAPVNDERLYRISLATNH